MELTDHYENLNEFHRVKQGEGGFQSQQLNERGVQPAEHVGRKLLPVVVYILLGLCILLSALTLGVVVVQFAGNLEKSSCSIAKLQAEISKPREGNFEKINGSLAKLQAAISQLKENLPALQSFNKWKFFNHRLYYFSLSEVTSDEAQEFCASMNSKLVVINSGEEQAYIQENRKQDHWIGLRYSAKERTWLWVDGTSYTSNVKFWASDQPNGGEDCCTVSDNGLWHDWPCNNNHFFICEKPAW
ncbi:C-type lectin domain family 4 member E-like isoform X2 [Hemitrygon akajei]|uniref:C-type lectin domain family 4 member E-like isoform X2 n=1 Tax=Hemitrygon akajei TaxID=2704970 RepID=UPI003BFA0987